MAAAHDAFFSVHSQLFVVSALHVSLSVFVAHGSVSAEKEYIIKYNDIMKNNCLCLTFIYFYSFLC